MRKPFRSPVLSAVAAAALLLAGCGQSDPATPAVSDPPSTSPSLTAEAEGVHLIDGWAKAVDNPEDDAMTAVFGTLRNDTDTAVHITGGSSPQAHMVELHETVMADGVMTMREAEGGFIVEPGQDLVLEPGGHHIMLMGLSSPIQAGTDVEVTLTTESGADIVLVVPARTFAGAEETYAPGGMDGHDMGDEAESETP